METNIEQFKKLFNFLKEKGLTQFESYDDYVRGTSKGVEVLIKKEIQKEAPSFIDLEVVAQKQQTKAEKRKEKYNEWKDEMPAEERADYNEVFNEND